MPKHFTYFEIKEQCKGEVGLWFSFILFSKIFQNFGMTESLKLLNIVWNDVLDIGTMREREAERGGEILCAYNNMPFILIDILSHMNETYRRVFFALHPIILLWFLIFVFVNNSLVRAKDSIDLIYL